MLYKKFKDIELSTLGMGNMRLPVTEDKEIDYPKAKAIIDQAYKDGINYYDTAYIYHGGKSEEFVGKALKEYPRDSYYVATKFNINAQPDYKKQFSEQLERLDMDHVDFYLLHGVGDQNAERFKECGCIEYFDSMKKEGKITYFGFSYHGRPACLREFIKLYPFDFVQIQFNYYDYDHFVAKELYEILAEANIPVMVMEPVHGGLLANLCDEAKAVMPVQYSLASYAMRFVKQFPAIQVVLSGMGTVEQMLDNVATFSDTTPLTDEELTAIHKACDIQYSKVTVPCTGCNYCAPNCPMGLEIPYLLQQYNDAKIGGAWRLATLAALPEDKLPSNCIQCGSCSANCPQSFDIPSYLQDLVSMMPK